jgi:predicted ATPase
MASDRIIAKGNPAMIRQVTIRNFKCLRDVTVNLKPFTVFVGANGSGKTSFLQALDLLCRTFRSQESGSIQPGLMDREYLPNRTYGEMEPVELTCESGAYKFRYRTSTNENHPHRGKNWSGDGPAVIQMNALTDWNPWEMQKPGLPRPLWLRLDANALRIAGDVNPSDRQKMNPNGQGMHSATASMALEDPDLWNQLQKDLRQIVKSVVRLRHTPNKELLFDTVNGKSLKANHVSEGTLLTLGLLTAIHGADKPGLLLLDDLDRALHPKAQKDLIDLLRGVMKTNPELQIVASTHSPYMLDNMKPEEVVVTSLREDGTTACEPLTRHPKFETWKDEFHSGEMWSVFGEKWVEGPEVAAK